MSKFDTIVEAKLRFEKVPEAVDAAILLYTGCLEDYGTGKPFLVKDFFYDSGTNFVSKHPQFSEVYYKLRKRFHYSQLFDLEKLFGYLVIKGLMSVVNRKGTPEELGSYILVSDELICNPIPNGFEYESDVVTNLL